MFSVAISATRDHPVTLRCNARCLLRVARRRRRWCSIRPAGVTRTLRAAAAAGVAGAFWAVTRCRERQAVRMVGWISKPAANNRAEITALRKANVLIRVDKKTRLESTAT